MSQCSLANDNETGGPRNAESRKMVVLDNCTDLINRQKIVEIVVPN